MNGDAALAAIHSLPYAMLAAKEVCCHFIPLERSRARHEGQSRDEPSKEQDWLLSSLTLARIAGGHDVFLCLGADHRSLLAGTLAPRLRDVCHWDGVLQCPVSPTCHAGRQAVCVCGCAPSEWQQP